MTRSTRGNLRAGRLLGLAVVGIWLAVGPVMGSTGAMATGESSSVMITSTPSPRHPTQEPVKEAQNRGDQGETMDVSGIESQWLIALVAALAGALITLLGDRVWTTIQEKRSLTTLLKYLGGEIRLIRDEALTRESRQSSGAFPFDAPLPTNAWSIVSESAVAWRLVRKEPLFSSLANLYDKVHDANHRNQVAAEMFTLVQGGTLADSEARFLLDKAMLLVTEPYKEVALQAKNTLNTFSDQLGKLCL